MTIESTPNGWAELESTDDYQLQAFQRRRDGLVLSVERGTTSHRRGKHTAVTLPQNYHEDNQVIDTVTTHDDRDVVEDDAVEYMKEHPRT